MAPSSTLPHKLTGFIGREREIAEIKRLLQVGRLLTLTGPGGSGKTRLAIEAAEQMAAAFPGGVCFVPLAAIDDPMLLPAAIAQAVGVKETGGQSIMESLKADLHGKEMLLLLDNFEQITPAAVVVVDLLKACLQLWVMATSRAALHVTGEREFVVPPLQLPDLNRVASGPALMQTEAVELFVQRARAVKHDFALTAENSRTVAEICHRLDGLPLAIELAAPRIRILSPGAILSRLKATSSTRLDLLSAGPRDFDARHQALRTTIEWSYEQLDDIQKALFRTLGTFVGGFSLPAVEEVCSAALRDVAERSYAPAHKSRPDNILDNMSALVNASLLNSGETTGGEPRFTMLETIKEYAVEQMAASGEAAMLRERHAAYYLILAENADHEIRGPRQVEWLDCLEREHGNLRTALSGLVERKEVDAAARLARSLCWFWFAHGHLGEGRRWLEQVLAYGELIPAAERAKLLAGAARIANYQADYEGAAGMLTEALALYRGVGDSRGAADALNLLGTVAIYSADHQAARRHYEHSLAIFRHLREKVGIAKCLANLGTVAFYSGDYAGARCFYLESLGLQRELGDMWAIAASLANLGAAALNQREYGQAAAYYLESLPLLNDLSDKASLAECLEGFAAAIGTWRGGMTGRAMLLFGAADALREGIGAPLSAASRPEYERNVYAVRAQLGGGDAVIAWEKGRQLTLEEALSLSLATEIAPQYPHAALTKREMDVLRLLAAGLSNNQIALQLSVSRHTVHAHVTAIYGKLGITSRAAATRYALDNNLA